MADSTATDWFYRRNGDPAGQQAGPVTWEQLVSLAQAGVVAPADLVWNPSLPEWAPAAQITGLFPAVAAGAVQAPHPESAQAGAAYEQGTRPPAAPSRSRRRSWLYWVVPLVVLIVVGSGLGAYFGLRGGGGETTATTAVSTTTTVATTTTAAVSSTLTTLSIGDLRAQYPSSESFDNASLDVLAADPDSHKGAAVTLTAELLTDGYDDEIGGAPVVSFYLDFPYAVVLCSTETGSPLLKEGALVTVRGLVRGLVSDGVRTYPAIYVESVTQGAEMEATTTTTEEVTTTTADLSHKWGAAATVNGLRITVREPIWDKDTYVAVNGTPDSTQKIIVAEVVLENTGSTPHIYDASDFSLLCSDSDQWYYGDSQDSTGVPAGKPAMRSGYLQPGKKIYRYLRFIVPADTAAVRIEYAEAEATDTQAAWEYK